MNHARFTYLGPSILACLGMAGTALAGGRGPGSLLLFPEFDNRPGMATVFTVTNVKIESASPSVWAEIVYIGREGTHGQILDCAETNLTFQLTPGDTLTFLTSAQNPNQNRGYAYVFPKSGPGSIGPGGSEDPIAYDWLTGNVMTVDGIQVLEYSMNPVTYLASEPDFTPVDDDGDGLLDMDGCEYEQNPDEFLFPRFLGQGPFLSDLILIDFTGRQFVTRVDFLVYNDNEEVFSDEAEFQCWTSIPLTAVSGIFDNGFLQAWTNHDPGEILGAPQFEAGWFRLWGAISNSTSATENEPAIYAVLVERTVEGFGVSDLPFEKGLRATGALLSRTLGGDTVESCPNDPD